MKNFKNQKGITLVALVVTIIILLILAGVSLSLVAGSRGIMTRATNAVSTNEAATAAEQAELKIAEIQVDYYEAYYVKESINTSMRAYIEEKIGAAGVSCANTRYKMKIDTTAGEISVYVVSTSEKGEKKVASRKYNKTEDNFAWEANKWTFYDSYGGAPAA